MQTTSLSVDVTRRDAPTVEQFICHAQRFGAEYVRETAERYLAAPELAALDAELALLAHRNGKPTARQRRTTATLRAQVVELDRRGLVRAAIADALNISDRRVADILGKSRTSENGGQKRLAQAELFAA
jgi:hypothetical protein